MAKRIRRIRRRKERRFASYHRPISRVPCFVGRICPLNGALGHQRGLEYYRTHTKGSKSHNQHGSLPSGSFAITVPWHPFPRPDLNDLMVFARVFVLVRCMRSSETTRGVPKRSEPCCEHHSALPTRNRQSSKEMKWSTATRVHGRRRGSPPFGASCAAVSGGRARPILLGRTGSGA